MNIYDAIMKAADHIERNPRDYAFESGAPIERYGGRGCALAWIGHFLGVKPRDLALLNDKLYAGNVAEDICGSTDIDVFFEGCEHGVSHAESAPDAMRRFAKKYHAPKFIGIPDSIRAIFTNIPGEYVS